MKRQQVLSLELSVLQFEIVYDILNKISEGEL